MLKCLPTGKSEASKTKQTKSPLHEELDVKSHKKYPAPKPPTAPVSIPLANTASTTSLACARTEHQADSWKRLSRSSSVRKYPAPLPPGATIDNGSIVHTVDVTASSTDNSGRLTGKNSPNAVKRRPGSPVPGRTAFLPVKINTGSENIPTPSSPPQKELTPDVTIDGGKSESNILKTMPRKVQTVGEIESTDVGNALPPTNGKPKVSSKQKEKKSNKSATNKEVLIENSDQRRRSLSSDSEDRNSRASSVSSNVSKSSESSSKHGTKRVNKLSGLTNKFELESNASKLQDPKNKRLRLPISKISDLTSKFQGENVPNSIRKFPVKKLNGNVYSKPPSLDANDVTVSKINDSIGGVNVSKFESVPTENNISVAKVKDGKENAINLVDQNRPETLSKNGDVHSQIVEHPEVNILGNEKVNKKLKGGKSSKLSSVNSGATAISKSQEKVSVNENNLVRIVVENENIPTAKVTDSNDNTKKLIDHKIISQETLAKSGGADSCVLNSSKIDTSIGSRNIKASKGSTRPQSLYDSDVTTAKVKQNVGGSNVRKFGSVSEVNTASTNNERDEKNIAKKSKDGELISHQITREVKDSNSLSLNTSKVEMTNTSVVNSKLNASKGLNRPQSLYESNVTTSNANQHVGDVNVRKFGSVSEVNSTSTNNEKDERNIAKKSKDGELISHQITPEVKNSNSLSLNTCKVEITNTSVVSSKLNASKGLTRPQSLYDSNVTTLKVNQHVGDVNVRKFGSVAEVNTAATNNEKDERNIVKKSTDAEVILSKTSHEGKAVIANGSTAKIEIIDTSPGCKKETIINGSRPQSLYASDNAPSNMKDNIGSTIVSKLGSALAVNIASLTKKKDVSDVSHKLIDDKSILHDKLPKARDDDSHVFSSSHSEIASKPLNGKKPVIDEKLPEDLDSISVKGNLKDVPILRGESEEIIIEETTVLTTDKADDVETVLSPEKENVKQTVKTSQVPNGDWKAVLIEESRIELLTSNHTDMASDENNASHTDSKYLTDLGVQKETKVSPVQVPTMDKGINGDIIEAKSGEDMTYLSSEIKVDLDPENHITNLNHTDSASQQTLVASFNHEPMLSVQKDDTLQSSNLGGKSSPIRPLPLPEISINEAESTSPSAYYTSISNIPTAQSSIDLNRRSISLDNNNVSRTNNVASGITANGSIFKNYGIYESPSSPVLNIPKGSLISQIDKLNISALPLPSLNTNLVADKQTVIKGIVKDTSNLGNVDATSVRNIIDVLSSQRDFRLSSHLRESAELIVAQVQNRTRCKSMPHSVLPTQPPAVRAKYIPRTRPIRRPDPLMAINIPSLTEYLDQAEQRLAKALRSPLPVERSESTDTDDDVFLDTVDHLEPLPEIGDTVDHENFSNCSTPIDFRGVSPAPKRVVEETSAMLSETDILLRKSRSTHSLRRSFSRSMSIANMNKLAEVSADLQEQHSTSHLASERMEAEQSERMRLEKEVSQLQEDVNLMTNANDKLEMERYALRSEMIHQHELNGDSEESDSSIYKRKYEWGLRELEILKKQVKQQEVDAVDQMVVLRKRLEKRAQDSHEEAEERRQVVGQLKKKSQRLQAEMNDLKMLLEEQNSRNNLLEKKQRKFDHEMNVLQDELKKEKLSKDKLQREKDQILAEKYSLDQEYSTMKLEGELKTEKITALKCELEDIHCSGKGEEETANLKKVKYDLEKKCKDQEEELDDLAGQIQILEAVKIRLEMSIEQTRKENRMETQQREEEVEDIRLASHKKIKALENQLESDYEERTQLLREKHDLERRLADANDRTLSNADEEYIHKLKKELKKTKALLKDMQTMFDKTQSEGSNKMIVRQLKTQLEDAEFAKTAALKARQCAEADCSEMQLQLDEAYRAKKDTEDRCLRINKEKSSIQMQLEENEEEVSDLMKKYKAAVSQLSVDQITMVDQTQQMAELEHDKHILQEKLMELSSKVEILEGETANIHTQRRLQMKIKELESKLELEQTTKGRLDGQLVRLKDSQDRLNSELDAIRMKEVKSSEDSKRFSRLLRESKDDLNTLQQKNTDAVNRKCEIEKQLEISESEVATLKSDLKLAFKRIEDLQQALQGEISDSDSDLMDSASESESSLSSYLTASLRCQRASSNSTLRTPPSEMLAESKEDVPRSSSGRSMSAISEDLEETNYTESFA